MRQRAMSQIGPLFTIGTFRNQVTFGCAAAGCGGYALSPGLALDVE